MDFGLGLILSFTDNATAGINSAVDSLGHLTLVAENASKSVNEFASLSAFSVVARQMGESFTSMGQGILSTVTNIIGSVNDVGMTMMYAGNQLSKLYGGADAGADKLKQIQDYAKQSIFNFEDLIPVVTTLKSVGIEAFDSIASSTGNANQTLMDYASDLAAFMPNMKNAYGTGIKAAMGALKEYIAEGNAMSLKRGAGLDITGILGEDKGATIEERSRQIADLIEKLGMVGMTSDLMGTPTQMLSNMGDVLFQLKNMISDSGVFEAYTNLISKVAAYIFAIPEEELQNIASVIGEALSSIMKPLEWVADKVLAFADSIRYLVENHPSLVKFAIVGTVVAGVLLLLVGIALKVASAFSGLSLMLLTAGKSFKSIGVFMKSGVLKIIGTLLPLIAVAGLLALAWKNDFAGIKSNVTHFVSNLTDSFKTAKNAVNGSVGDLSTTLNDLNNKDDFFSNITRGMIKVMITGRALSDAWGDYTLSEDNFLKAKEAGVLPLIESILDLKYRFEKFSEGFKEGWQNISDKVRDFFSGLASSVEGTALESVLDSLTTFFDKLTNNDPETWKELGETFAYIISVVAPLLGVIKVIGAISKAIGGLYGIVKGISAVFGFFGKLWGIITKVWGLITTVVTGIGKAITAVLGFFGVVVSLPAWLVGVIAIAIATLIALVVKYWDEICAFFKTVGTWIYDNVIVPIGEFFVGLWDGIVEGVSNAIENIKSFLGTVATWVYDNVITPIVEFFTTAWNDLVSLFSTIGEAVGSAIKGAVTTAVNRVLSSAVRIINGFISAINFAIGVINAIPGVSISTLSPLGVPQLATGGVVDNPTLSVIGEAGAEAVVPLENNLGWLDNLASMLVTKMNSNLVPTNTSMSTNSGQGENTQKYLTSNSSTSTTYEGDTDNSIIFNEGAIQVNVQNASDEEAYRLAKKILEYIKRQKELDRMMCYA